MNFGKLYRGSRKLAAKTLPKPALKLIKKVYSFPVVGMGGSLITNERIEVNLSLLERCSELEGDVIECGVYRGGNLIELAKKLKSIESNKVVYGLDTFEGLPVVSGDKDDLRFQDPPRHVVGLTAKGQAKKDTSGFVVN